MEALKNLLTEFDPAAFVPQLGSVIGWMELILRICVLAGPIALLVMGLWYLILPPKEANHIAGYRFFWGMGSVQSWKVMQFLAGVGWAASGLVLTITMVVITNGYRGMDMMAMGYSAIRCILWQIGAAALTCVLVNLSMMIMFTFKGDLRPWFNKGMKKSEAPKKKKPAQKPKTAAPKESKPKKAEPKESKPKKAESKSKK
jgi:hypothetical protein